MEQTFCKREGIDYIQNYFRFTLFDKIKKMYLLTVDDGNYIFINSSVFKQIRKGKIIDELTYSNLLAKGVLITPNNISNIITANSVASHVPTPTRMTIFHHLHSRLL